MPPKRRNASAGDKRKRQAAEPAQARQPQRRRLAGQENAGEQPVLPPDGANQLEQAQGLGNQPEQHLQDAEPRDFTAEGPEQLQPRGRIQLARQMVPVQAYHNYEQRALITQRATWVQNRGWVPNDQLPNEPAPERPWSNGFWYFMIVLLILIFVCTMLFTLYVQVGALVGQVLRFIPGAMNDMTTPRLASKPNDVVHPLMDPKHLPPPLHKTSTVSELLNGVYMPMDTVRRDTQEQVVRVLIEHGPSVTVSNTPKIEPTLVESYSHAPVEVTPDLIQLDLNNTVPIALVEAVCDHGSSVTEPVVDQASQPEDEEDETWELTTLQDLATKIRK
jgi:hypothetical protein